MSGKIPIQETEKCGGMLTSIGPITFQDPGNTVIRFSKNEHDMRMRLMRRGNTDKQVSKCTFFFTRWKNKQQINDMSFSAQEDEERCFGRKIMDEARFFHS